MEEDNLDFNMSNIMGYSEFILKNSKDLAALNIAESKKVVELLNKHATTYKEVADGRYAVKRAAAEIIVDLVNDAMLERLDSKSCFVSSSQYGVSVSINLVSMARHLLHELSNVKDETTQYSDWDIAHSCRIIVEVLEKVVNNQENRDEGKRAANIFGYYVIAKMYEAIPGSLHIPSCMETSTRFVPLPAFTKYTSIAFWAISEGCLEQMRLDEHGQEGEF